MTLPRISIAARTRCGIDASAGTLSSTLSNGHLPIKKRQPASSHSSASRSHTITNARS